MLDCLTAGLPPYFLLLPPAGLNCCKLYIAVFPAKPEQQPLDQSDPRWTSSASSRWQCSLPDLNGNMDQSDPRRTSTASSRSQCSLPDWNGKLRIRAFPAGPPPQAPDQRVPCRTSTTKNLRRYNKECEKICQKVYQSTE